eukprot:scaffold121305_cov42-Phaeocystis_antarctica.AAC.2
MPPTPPPWQACSSGTTPSSCAPGCAAPTSSSRPRPSSCSRRGRASARCRRAPPTRRSPSRTPWLSSTASSRWALTLTLTSTRRR